MESSVQGFHAWYLFVCFLFVWLREEGVDIFLKLIPNIWDRHAPEDNGEDVMMSC